MAQNKHYDTPHRARVQDAHAFLLNKEIAHDERNILEFFNIKEWVGYQIIQLRVFLYIKYHLVKIKICK